MKKLILTIAVALSSLTLVGQTSQTNEPTVEFDVNRGLYIVHTDAGNWHHVTEDGTLHGPFKHTFNNVVIKGSMKSGKRHGTFITYVDGREHTIVDYDMGKPLTYTRVLE